VRFPLTLAVGEALSVAVASAGSASLVLIGSVSLQPAVFGSLSLLITLQVVLGLLLRALFGEPVVQDISRDGRVQLLRHGTLVALLCSAVLLVAGVSLFPVPLMIALAASLWTVCWYFLEFARCWMTISTRSSLAAWASLGSLLLFLASIALQWRGHSTNVVFAVWSLAFLVAGVAATCGLYWAHKGDCDIIVRIEAKRIWRDLQLRFLGDAVFLQVFVQLAIFFSSLLASLEIVIAFRLSQVVYFPLTLATLLAQTRTVASLSWPRHGFRTRFITSAVWKAWALTAVLTVAPIIILVPEITSIADRVLPANFAPLVALLAIIAATKCADLILNFGVSVLRGYGDLKKSSRYRRLWGVVSSVAIVVATLWTGSATAVFVAMLIVSGLCAAFMALTLFRLSSCSRPSKSRPGVEV